MLPMPTERMNNSDLHISSDSPVARGVVIVSPGGREGGGGMGSVTRSILDWLGEHQPDLPTWLIDPRGTGSVWVSPLCVLNGMLRLVWVRARYRPRILHLQVSERTSFLRKGLFLLLGRAMGMRVVLHHHGAELVSFFENASRL